MSENEITNVRLECLNIASRESVVRGLPHGGNPVDKAKEMAEWVLGEERDLTLPNIANLRAALWEIADRDRYVLDAMRVVTVRDVLDLLNNFEAVVAENIKPGVLTPPEGFVDYLIPAEYQSLFDALLAELREDTNKAAAVVAVLGAGEDWQHFIVGNDKAQAVMDALYPKEDEPKFEVTVEQQPCAQCARCEACGPTAACSECPHGPEELGRLYAQRVREEMSDDRIDCAHCGLIAKGWAMIGDRRYCHDGKGETCYMKAMQGAEPEPGGGRATGEHSLLTKDEHTLVYDTKWSVGPVLALARAARGLDQAYQKVVAAEQERWAALQKTVRELPARSGQRVDYDGVMAAIQEHKP